MLQKGIKLWRKITAAWNKYRNTRRNNLVKAYVVQKTFDDFTYFEAVYIKLPLVKIDENCWKVSSKGEEYYVNIHKGKLPRRKISKNYYLISEDRKNNKFLPRDITKEIDSTIYEKEIVFDGIKGEVINIDCIFFKELIVRLALSNKHSNSFP